MNKLFFLYFSILFISSSIFADESLIQIKQKLEKIERDISDIQKVVFSKNNNNLSIDSNNQSTTSSITIFDMRLRDIENELKSVNLNYENVFFEIEDLKKSLEILSLELNDAIIEINTKINSNINISSANKDIKESKESDSFSQNVTEESNTLGTLKINSEDLSNNEIDTGDKTIYSSPEEQFQAAFDNLRNQKFEIAKSELKLFIEEHNSHTLAGSAHYWLGEIYILQKEYREAALIFAEGYQKYPESVKSPDSLYKLAETLLKIEKQVEACNTLNQLVLKYPNNKLIDKTKSKINELQCS